MGKRLKGSKINDDSIMSKQTPQHCQTEMCIV